MDMRIYYRKINEIEHSLPDDWIVVMSLETPEGGRAGGPAEVTRRNAARLIVDGRARLATEDEKRAYRSGVTEAKRAADEAAAASRVQMSVIPTAELQNLKSRKG